MELTTGDGTQGASDLTEFRTLVRAAFDKARQGGKPDWEEMTSAVLKNRLLNLTQGQFSESRYGSPSFIHLVRRVPDLLTVISDVPPFRLRIVAPAAEQEDDVTVASEKYGVIGLSDDDLLHAQVRSDFWQAVLDYSSGSEYVLDPDDGAARSKGAEDADCPVLPTVTRDAVVSWRRDFVESLDPAVKAGYEDELNSWANGRGRQSDLPRQFHGPWAKYFKREVLAIILTWFKQQQIQPPGNLIVIRKGRKSSPNDVVGEAASAELLRDTIIRAVRIMTPEELSRISLPATVVLRLPRGGR